jgi:nicotinamidase-related amidase
VNAIPDPHPQWAALDVTGLLRMPTALVVIDPTNSVLAEAGAQAADGIGARGRVPGGSLHNLMRLVPAARRAGTRVAWLRYEYLRDHYPATPMDQAQYRHRFGKRRWSTAEKAWDAALVDELAALLAADDVDIVYRSFGNVFLGTPLQQILGAWGVRTLLLTGYHLDECVEQAARTARDLSFMPIVVGDAAACADEGDERTTLKRIDSRWAPVLSTDRILDLLSCAA